MKVHYASICAVYVYVLRCVLHAAVVSTCIQQHCVRACQQMLLVTIERFVENAQQYVRARLPLFNCLCCVNLSVQSNWQHLIRITTPSSYVYEQFIRCCQKKECRWNYAEQIIAEVFSRALLLFYEAHYIDGMCKCIV